MKSGIYIDDQFIGITAHSVSVYFDVIRKIIRYGEPKTLTLPHETGYGQFLITAHTRLRSNVALDELPEESGRVIEENPFGNFPSLVREYLDADDDLWEIINSTDLGNAIKALDAPGESE